MRSGIIPWYLILASRRSRLPFAQMSLLALDGTLARDGTLGRWLNDADDFVGDFSPDAVHGLVFPRNWPATFKQSEALKALINRQLRGVRCRAISYPSSGPDADEARVAPVMLRSALHSFTNAEMLAAALPGWKVAKGFLVFEQSDKALGESFVAVRHWWLVSPAGTWVDMTPPLVASDKALLVESPLGDRAEAPLSPSGRSFAAALAKRFGLHDSERMEADGAAFGAVNGSSAGVESFSSHQGHEAVSSSSQVVKSSLEAALSAGQVSAAPPSAAAVVAAAAAAPSAVEVAGAAHASQSAPASAPPASSSAAAAGAASTRAAASAIPTEVMRPGDLAHIDGLQGRPELNGRCARVVLWDAARGRFHVEVASTCGDDSPEVACVHAYAHAYAHACTAASSEPQSAWCLASRVGRDSGSKAHQSSSSPTSRSGRRFQQRSRQRSRGGDRGDRDAGGCQ